MVAYRFGQDDPQLKGSQSQQGQDDPRLKGLQSQQGQDDPRLKGLQSQQGQDDPRLKGLQSQQGQDDPWLKGPQSQQGQDDPQLKVLQSRQERITSALPRFARVTIPAAVILLVASFVIRLFTDTVLRDDITSVRFSSITIGTIISLTLGLFSNLVVCLFVVWSLAFVPYVSLQAHKASQELDIGLVTKPLRWLQLYAAAFLPMAVFATAWNSFAVEQNITIAVPISSQNDFIILVLATTLVVGLLTGSNYLINVRFAVARLSFFSFLLYLSLFLAYGRGVSVASHSMVFGIMIYLMFGASQVAELVRRISLHDVDPRIVERVEGITNRRQDLQSQKSETTLTRQEHQAELAKQQLEVEMTQAKSDLLLNKQLADIKEKKINLNKDINHVQLQVYETRIEALGKAFGVMSKEFNDRIKNDIPAKIAQLSVDVKTLSQEEIGRRMNGIVADINVNLQGIPESMEQLRKQLNDATKELEKQMLLLSDKSSDEESNKQPS